MKTEDDDTVIPHMMMLPRTPGCDNIETFHQQMCLMAEDMYSVHKQVLHSIFAVLPDKLWGFQCVWETDQSKRELLDLLRHLFLKAKVERYSFLLEAWEATLDKNTPEEYKRMAPMDRPDRRECVICLTVEQGGRFKTSTWLMVNNGNKKELKLRTKPEISYEGIFYTLLMTDEELRNATRSS